MTDRPAVLDDIDDAIDELLASDRNGARRIGTALADWRARGAPLSLDGVLGLKPGPGERSLQSVMATEERDRLLRDAADRYLPDRPIAEQARILHLELSRYRASAWRFEQRRDVCPASSAGTMRVALWRILKLAPNDISDRTIRRILATS